MTSSATIWGRPRSEVAAALTEYRAFIRENPEDVNVPDLRKTITLLRNQIRMTRDADRRTMPTRRQNAMEL